MKLEELERELLEVNANAERLARSFSELVELQLVLERASHFFDDAQHRASTAAFETRPADSKSPFSTVPLTLPGITCTADIWHALDISKLVVNVLLEVLCEVQSGH